MELSRSANVCPFFYIICRLLSGFRYPRMPFDEKEHVLYRKEGLGGRKENNNSTELEKSFVFYTQLWLVDKHGERNIRMKDLEL